MAITLALVLEKSSSTLYYDLNEKNSRSILLKSLHRLILITFFLLFALKIFGATETSTNKDIKILDSKILELKSGISRIANKRSLLLNLLEDSEKNINNLNKDISYINSKISQIKTNIKEIREDQIQILRQHERLLERVTQTFRHVWQVGRRSELQVLLSNEDPAKLSRNLKFYRLIVSSEIDTIENYKKGLTKLAASKKKLEDSQVLLSKQRKKLGEKKKMLARLSKSRTELVKILAANISNRRDQIKSLQNDRARLEALLDQFNDSKVIKNENFFLHAKGKMSWPTKGELKNYYGMPRNDGKMFWQGVTIHTEEDEKVHAIHYGRIVYSDWFRGLGLLVIIDHGDGYMSLYAHNNSVSKNLGEWVTPRMPIATAGNSGGLEKSSLYFEIRHNGKPTDPTLWCTN